MNAKRNQNSAPIMSIFTMTTSSVGPLGLLLALVGFTCLCQASHPYRQQQQQNHHQRPIPPLRYYSDLVHSASTIELPSPSFKSLSYKLAAQENQINDKYGAHPALKDGPRAVINGNHATYVEPPADFKPIIYEHSHVSPNRNNPAANSRPEQSQQYGAPNSPASSNGESFMESPNHLVASMLAPISGQSSSRQQQKRQIQAQTSQLHQHQHQQHTAFNDNNQKMSSTSEQQTSDTMGAAPLGGLNSNTNDAENEESNSLPMKPSIDRWSDWYDMSIDPDLASSETELALSSKLAPPEQAPQQQQHPRKQGGVQAPSSQGVAGPSLPVQMIKASTLINQFHQQQQEQQQQQRMFAANLIKMQQPPVGKAAAASFEPRHDYFLQASQPRNHLNEPHQQLIMGSPQENHRLYQQRPSAPHSQAFYYHPQQQQPQPSPQMARSNFPVISLPLPLTMLQKHHQSRPEFPVMRHYQQQQQQQQTTDGKKATNLFKAATSDKLHHPELVASVGPEGQARKLQSQIVPSAEVNLANEQQQRKLDRLLSAPLVMSALPQEVSSHKQVNAVAGAGGLATAASRVAAPQGGKPVNQRQSRPTAASVATVPAQPLAQSSTNSTATPATPPKRVIRRRRIKTLLPVGMSSWFLGGIRDLDARHWKLPSEIMTKLAINDVDFQHPELAGSTHQPADESTSVVDLSNTVQAGGSLERAEQPRPSAAARPQASQMSPR